MDNMEVLLDKAMHRMTQWTSECRQMVSGITNEEQPRALKNKIQDLKESLHNAEAERKSVSNDTKHQVEDIQVQVDILKDKLAEEERQITLLQGELSHLAQKQASLKEANLCDTAMMEEKRKRYEEEEVWFRKNTGLEINKVKDGCLQFIFTQIDAKNPDMPFMFSLKLDKNRKYEANGFQPPLSNAEDLVSQLNASNDLSSFVHSVRKHFQAMGHT